MKEHKFNDKYFIKGYYIPKHICDDIIEYFNNNKHRHHEGKIGYSHGLENDKNNKESTETSEPPNSFLNMFSEYKMHLQECLNNYLNFYLHCNKVERFTITENLNIQYYTPKQGFKMWHFENSGTLENKKRHLVFMTYLNDVDNGGTDFLYQGITSPAKKGLTLIWPAGWTHTHKGQISPDKEKYIVTGWYSFVE